MAGAAGANFGKNMMRRLLLATLTLTGALAFSNAAQAAPEDALGRWLNAKETGYFEIARCGDSVCGTIIGGKAQGGPERDVHNPDPNLRGRPLVGLRFMEGYRRTDTGWTGGRIYDPGRGRWFGSELRPMPDGSLHMKGCLGPVCQTQVWHRAPPGLEPGHPPAD